MSAPPRKPKKAAAGEGGVIRLSKAHFARVLYTNPVCLLTSALPTAATAAATAPAARTRNVMTISWLTATSNHGDIMLSMNASRFSATIVQRTKRFVLSVPVSGMEPTIRAIGGCSGFECDKFADLKLQVVRPGELTSSVQTDATAAANLQPATDSKSTPPQPIATATTGTPSAAINATTSSDNKSSAKPQSGAIAAGGDAEQRRIDSESALAGDIAIGGCGICAHMIVSIQHIITPPPHPLPTAATAASATAAGADVPYGVYGHLLLFGRVDACWVRSEYWNGNLFIPQPIRELTTAADVKSAPNSTAASSSVRYPPAYLTFLGSSKFALVQQYDEIKPAATATDGSTSTASTADAAGGGRSRGSRRGRGRGRGGRGGGGAQPETTTPATAPAATVPAITPVASAAAASAASVSVTALP